MSSFEVGVFQDIWQDWVTKQSAPKDAYAYCVTNKEARVS